MQRVVSPTNIHVVPSTGVINNTKVSRSKPSGNTMRNRILLAKSVEEKKVEEHPRKNKFELNKTNRVDSSISYKRTVINSNSAAFCKTCNECLISGLNHECVVNEMINVGNTPVKSIKNAKQVKEIWKPKRKMVSHYWKPTGRKFSNVGYQWKPIGQKFKLNESCPKMSRSMPSKKWKPTGRIIPSLQLLV